MDTRHSTTEFSSTVWKTVRLSAALLDWFQFYIANMKFIISRGDDSQTFDISCEIAQSSCLGPQVFLLYMYPLGEIIRLHNMKLRTTVTLSSIHGYELQYNGLYNLNSIVKHLWSPEQCQASPDQAVNSNQSPWQWLHITFNFSSSCSGKKPFVNCAMSSLCSDKAAVVCRDIVIRGTLGNTDKCQVNNRSSFLPTARPHPPISFQSGHEWISWLKNN